MEYKTDLHSDVELRTVTEIGYGLTLDISLLQHLGTDFCSRYQIASTYIMVVSIH